MKTIRFTYKGDVWNVYLVPADEMVQLAEDDDTPAFVEPSNKEIFFSDDSELNLSNILHEMWHVAFSYQYIDSAGLSSDQTEEVSAEVFSMEAEILLLLGHDLLKALKELRDKKTKDDEEINLDEYRQKKVSRKEK